MMSEQVGAVGRQASHAAAIAVHAAIHEALALDPKAREPMNALVIWTELGKGLAGKLEQQGADVGLLGRLVASYCKEKAHDRAVDLGAWAYRVAPEDRLSREELGRMMSRIQKAIGDRLARHWADGDGGAHAREDFLATTRGWFSVGLDVLRSFRVGPGPSADAVSASPGCSPRDDAEIYAALATWCDRYLPKDKSGPEDLGVRRERGVAEVRPC